MVGDAGDEGASAIASVLTGEEGLVLPAGRQVAPTQNRPRMRSCEQRRCDDNLRQRAKGNILILTTTTAVEKPTRAAPLCC